jgi:ParB-like chromosome segregation protein Spo0J
MADKNAPGAGDSGRKGVSSGKELGSNTAITIKTQGWRDWLPVHEAPEMFPLVSADELKELADDIAKNGMHSRITVVADETGKQVLLDGRNRLNALELLGRKIALGDSTIFEELSADLIDPYAYVISANIQRRHLTVDQKRDLIEKLLKATPENSNRQIAETVKASHHTVESVRTKMESTGQIAQLPKTFGKDGKERPTKSASKARSPATRKRRTEPPKDTVAAALNSLSWSEADASLRRRFVEAVGVASLLEAASAGSDYNILMNVWNRASAEERVRFLQFIGAEINEPGAAP